MDKGVFFYFHVYFLTLNSIFESFIQIISEYSNENPDKKYANINSCLRLANVAMDTGVCSYVWNRYFQICVFFINYKTYKMSII